MLIKDFFAHLNGLIDMFHRKLACLVAPPYPIALRKLFDAPCAVKPLLDGHGEGIVHPDVVGYVIAHKYELVLLVTKHHMAYAVAGSEESGNCLAAEIEYLSFA